MNILVKHPRSGLLPTVLYDRNCCILTIKGTSQPKLTKEGPSGEGKETVINTNVVMDSEAMSGLRDPSVFSWLLRAWSMVIMPMRCDFNGKKASADSEERSVSAGIRHLHRSPGQEDTKVVRQGQVDSYYGRFCEMVEMGLQGRVIDLDEVGLEHEADDEKEQKARYE